MVYSFHHVFSWLKNFFSSSRDVTVAGTAARRSARLERETHSYLAATNDIVAVVRHLFAPLLSRGKPKIKEEILRNTLDHLMSHAEACAWEPSQDCLGCSRVAPGRYPY